MKLTEELLKEMEKKKELEIAEHKAEHRKDKN